jgi:hypothetical protein
MKDQNLKNIFESQLYDLKNSSDWKSVLKLSEKFPHDLMAGYLWCWPSEFCLNHLGSVFGGLKITSVLSIGPGTGLLEWILMKSLGEYFEYIFTVADEKMVTFLFKFSRNKNCWARNRFKLVDIEVFARAFHPP